MKRLNRARLAGSVVALALASSLAMPAMSLAAQAPVNLGTTSTFAVLAGETITNTGPTTISGDAGGDVGVSPGSAFTGAASVTLSGATHLADAVALQAKNDLVAAYDDAAGRTPVTRIPTELGGTTLKPGVYDSASGTFHITGTLTLDAQGDPDGVFIFLTSSTLVTASNSRVSVVNSARYCRVFWKVGSSATLGTNSHFVGHIFALTSIAAQTGATVQGQLLARNGSVTLDTNTITNGICVAAQGAAISIAKSASPSALRSGSGRVRYTYRVSNRGTVALSGVVVTDNKIRTVTYVSGDSNGDSLLSPGETWVYSATATLRSTTTNIGTATASGNGVTVVDTDAVRVRVTDTRTVTGGTRTVTGGQIPNTATPWYNIFLVGAVLALAGAVSTRRTLRKARNQDQSA